ncbi:MAG: hypothetical protein LBD50_02355, partial [Rickettsiales bacterium]|nr:hypothetical protein [Rickettsiales bacterium]
MFRLSRFLRHDNRINKNMRTAGAFALLSAVLASAAYGGLAASVDYVHGYIQSKTDVSVAKNTLAEGTALANMQYLLSVMDAVNLSSAGSTSTEYRNSAQATTAAIPIENVWLSASSLFNCFGGGYYKTGSINTSDGTGSVSCDVCPVGSYCPEGTNNATACAAGYYTAGTGATAETDC